jgi:KaiC/GvpD/RAD55 family RecA-like ATPase
MAREEQGIADFVETLPLGDVPVCPMCLFDLAWAMHTDEVDRALVRRTIRWVWPEVEEAVRRVIVAARMRELPHAENALRDIEERGSRGVVAREVVTVLARRPADDFSRPGGGNELAC